MRGICSDRGRPRQRILDTARNLFRTYGIKGIGVEAIAEAAETNKMTLYRHFGSKDELIAECLRDVASRASAIWTDLETQHPDDPIAQLRGWVRSGAECVVSEGRGCDLANAAVQLPDGDHPAKRVIQEFKVAQRNRLADLCRRAGLENADLVSDTLSLLLEGARVNRQSVGPDGPCAQFVAAAEAVIAASQRGAERVSAGEHAR
jgi:AcrR family transcriptional regulator